MKKHVEVEDAKAMCNLGYDYYYGRYVPQDSDKALKLYHSAAELGLGEAYNALGFAHYRSIGVETGEKKADRYFELAAIGGYNPARHNLGVGEEQAGNLDRAIKHYIIAAGNGSHGSVNNTRIMYSDGRATKDDYAKVLQAYQVYLSKIKSHQRDEAALYSDSYNYYE